MTRSTFVPTTVVQIEEQAHIDDIMSKRLKFEKSFVPGTGTYAYEQQQRPSIPSIIPCSSPMRHNTARGGSFTIALENLIGRYLSAER